MNSVQVKSLLIFIVLIGVLFYFGNLVARESSFAVEGTEESVRFLDSVAVLDAIQFDLDFVNSLGDTAIKTDVYVRPFSSSDAGRDNPFRRSNPSVLFESPQDVFPGQGEVRSIQEQLPPPTPPDQGQEQLPPPISSDVFNALPEAEQAFLKEQGVVVLPVEEQQDPVAPPAEEEQGAVLLEESPEPSSAATLTR